MEYEESLISGAERLYQSAIDASPRNADARWSYAVFLRDARKDTQESEQLHQRAIDLEPYNAEALASYAAFITDVRGDPDKAEHLFQRGIEADPRNADNLERYAGFLASVRKDVEKAEALYKRAIDADPTDANHRANYAGFLLAIGQQTEGLGMLDLAMNATDALPPTRAECWFYAFAHGALERRGEALAELKRLLLDEGVRSSDWDFSPNIERARVDGHSDAKWLTALADVINEKADPRPWQAGLLGKQPSPSIHHSVAQARIERMTQRK